MKKKLKKEIKKLKKLNYRDSTFMDGRERNEYERDYARILYSDSFRRLEGKMQLLPVSSQTYHRNRLTHSLEVGQIAQSIATILTRETDMHYDYHVLQAAALAHDLGAPPFGRVGERILNDQMKEYGGFNIHAQTYRILTKLEVKHPNYRGLNLTHRTLLATVLYNVRQTKSTENYLYADDYEKFNATNTELSIKPLTLDAQIIKMANTIATCAHDLEDALRRRVFTINEFNYALRQYAKKNERMENYNHFKRWVEEAENIAVKHIGVFGESKPQEVNVKHYSQYFHKELISKIVHALIMDLSFQKVLLVGQKLSGTAKKKELQFTTYTCLVHMIETTIRMLTKQNEEVSEYEERAKRVITTLFDNYERDYHLISSSYRNSRDEKQRIIADYISGMTDQYAIEMYRKFKLLDK